MKRRPQTTSGKDVDRRGLCEEVAASVEYIEANFDRPLRLTEIAFEARLSTSRLGHLFSQQVGVSPIEYLMRVRLEHAKRLLRTTDYTCARISDTTGHKSQGYFARVFKRQTGVSPRQYRLRHSNRREN